MNKIELLLHFRKANCLATLKLMVNRKLKECISIKQECEVYLAECDREQEILNDLFMPESDGLTKPSQKWLRLRQRRLHECPVLAVLREQAGKRSTKKKVRLEAQPESIWGKPLEVERRAKQYIQLWKQGQRIGRTTRKRKYLVINVGQDWRLLSKDRGKSFVLLSHSEYNREVDL